MNGRLENEIIIEKSISTKCKDVPKYILEWNDTLKASGITASTRLDYITKVLNMLSYFMKENKNDISVIKEHDIIRYYTSIQTKDINGNIVYTSDSYQCCVWSCLNNFFNYMVTHGYMEQNYIKYITRPKNHDLDRINENRVRINTEDIKKIIEEVKDEKDYFLRTRDLLILLLFINTGMRKTALTGILIDDIDIAKKELSIIDKGKKRHIYILNDRILDALESWQIIRNRFAKTNHLFITKNGRPISGKGIYYIVEKYTEKALGKKLSPHKLRSGYCSILYEKTGDIEFVRRAVGHASSTTTQRYIVTKGDEKAKAAEIMSGILS